MLTLSSTYVKLLLRQKIVLASGLSLQGFLKVGVFAMSLLLALWIRAHELVLRVRLFRDVTRACSVNSYTRICTTCFFMF